MPFVVQFIDAASVGDGCQRDGSVGGEGERDEATGGIDVYFHFVRVTHQLYVHIHNYDAANYA